MNCQFGIDLDNDSITNIGISNINSFNFSQRNTHESVEEGI